MSTRTPSRRRALVRAALLIVAVATTGCSDSGFMAPAPGGLDAVHRHAHSAATCTATAPGPSSCPGVSVSISPYAPGAAFGDFQSGPGTGASSTITVTFSVKVSSVTITAQDPTFAGNQMQAFDETGGLLGTAPIAGNGTPGINVPQTVTITAVGIKSIKLIPAANDYVAYGGLTFTTQGTCATNDGVLDDPAVRNALKAALAASGAFNSNPASRQEQAGYIYQRADGSYDVRTAPPDPTLTTPCSSWPGVPAPQPGETTIAPWHTHPFAAGDPLPFVQGCASTPRRPTQYDNRRGGGGSAADWRFIETPDGNRFLPMYIIDKNEVFRLDPNVPVRQRSRNPNRFKWTNPACPW